MVAEKNMFFEVYSLWKRDFQSVLSELLFCPKCRHVHYQCDVKGGTPLAIVPTQWS